MNLDIFRKNDPSGKMSKEFYVNETGENCNKCPFKLTCLACIINE